MKQKIAETVKKNPGIHFRELERQVGCSKSTINHHINDIEGIDEEKIRGYRRFYPQNISATDRNLLAALNHSPRGEILYHLQEGLNVTEISEKTDRSPSTISEHLKILRKDNIVEKDSEYHLDKRFRNRIRKYASQILEKRVEGFINMWE